METMLASLGPGFTHVLGHTSDIVLWAGLCQYGRIAVEVISTFGCGFPCT